jgi:2-polyprenyl-3-methyl-5-hydroxy-6-metoxy-1,4-benzoquinol methylase
MLKKEDFNEGYYINGGSIGGYDNYSEETYLNNNPEETVVKLHQKLENYGVVLSGKKILVIGCAYGYSLRYFDQLGADAYGLDFSEYAISRVADDYKHKVFVGDARKEQTIIDIKEAISLQGKFDIILDEDMICCLTDQEAVDFRDASLKHGKALVHLTTENTALSEWYNYKSIEQWKALLGVNAKEIWLSRFNFI